MAQVEADIGATWPDRTITVALVGMATVLATFAIAGLAALGAAVWAFFAYESGPGSDGIERVLAVIVYIGLTISVVCAGIAAHPSPRWCCVLGVAAVTLGAVFVLRPAPLDSFPNVLLSYVIVSPFATRTASATQLGARTAVASLLVAVCLLAGGAPVSPTLFVVPLALPAMALTDAVVTRSPQAS